MRQFDFHEFLLVPLTPIHIGGGEESQLLPDDYRIGQSMIELLPARAVLARMEAAERAIWLKDLDRDAEGAFERLLKRAPDDLVRERIPISEESRNELGKSGRLGKIDAFIRSGGRAIVPGSTIKGALRTAWIEALNTRLKVKREGRDDCERAKDLEKKLLSLADGANATDTDPFRDVLVRDAPLPPDATLIDRARSWKKTDGRWGFDDRIQIHRERMRGVVDGGAPPLAAIRIGIRAEALRRLRQTLEAAWKKKGQEAHRIPDPQRSPIDARYLLLALEAHHAPLWKREVEEKFFAGEPGKPLREALALFGHLKRGGQDPDAALIRLGWAAHAEAKSVVGLRRIERRQVKGEGRIATEGSSRHVVDIAGHPAPFGWALLVRRDRWRAPQAWLPRPVRSHRPAGPRPVKGDGAGGASARPARALEGRIRYAKGTRVLLSDGEIAVLDEDVTEATRGEIMGQIDGSRETIDVREIERALNDE